MFTYLIETPIDPIEAAANLCQEQSTAQWTAGGIDEDLRVRYAAKVVRCEVLDKKQKPLLYPFVEGNNFTTAKIVIAHPVINFGNKIPNLITAAAGEGAFHCPAVNSIKLLDMELPHSFIRDFSGPHFGINGLRKLLNVYDRPFFTGVVKPNIGLKPEYFADLAYHAWKGGLDICKDDELLADVPYSPLKKRVELVIEKMGKAEDETGEKKMYIANITDEVDRILELHDLVYSLGGNAIMVNSLPVGLSGVRMLAKKSKIPIFSHFDFIASFSRMPNFGVASPVIVKLQRLVGCDGIIMPGLGKRMMVPSDEVVDSLHTCLNEMGEILPALPIPGGSDWAGTLQHMYETFGTIEFSMVPGRGVFGHPMGPESGARSLRQAWDAICVGKEIREYAQNHIELQKAIDFFGQKEE